MSNASSMNVEVDGHERARHAHVILLIETNTLCVSPNDRRKLWRLGYDRCGPKESKDPMGGGHNDDHSMPSNPVKSATMRLRMVIRRHGGSRKSSMSAEKRTTRGKGYRAEPDDGHVPQLSRPRFRRKRTMIYPM